MIAKYNKLLSDDDFYDLIEQANNEMKQYDIELAHQYVAKYISVYYRHDALFNNESLDEIIRTALDTFVNIRSDVVDLNKLNKILKNDYKLFVTKRNPICIKEI